MHIEISRWEGVKPKKKGGGAFPLEHGSGFWHLYKNRINGLKDDDQKNKPKKIFWGNQQRPSSGSVEKTAPSRVSPILNPSCNTHGRVSRDGKNVCAHANGTEITRE